jgi:hypothetical protein
LGLKKRNDVCIGEVYPFWRLGKEKIELLTGWMVQYVERKRISYQISYLSYQNSWRGEML